jgi:hypothetical protein
MTKSEYKNITHYHRVLINIIRKNHSLIEEGGISIRKEEDCILIHVRRDNEEKLKVEFILNNIDYIYYTVNYFSIRCKLLEIFEKTLFTKIYSEAGKHGNKNS